MKKFTLSLLLAFFSLSSVFAQVNLDSGLVAHYLFNGNANDESGNGHDGSITGGVNLTTDRFGNPNKAYDFDGSSGYITVPKHPDLNPSTGLTLSAWVKLDSLPASGSALYFIDKHRSTFSGNGCHMRYLHTMTELALIRKTKFETNQIILSIKSLFLNLSAKADPPLAENP